MEFETLEIPVGDMTFTARAAGPDTGRLVLLLHGFPESSWSWRSQLTALADAGYRVVAPDQRGYSAGARPEGKEHYAIPHLVADVVAMADWIGGHQIDLVGHDWGGPVAWHSALLRPDRVRAVAGLSVPYQPRGSHLPTAAMRARIGEGFYMIYFQEPGVADEELSRDPRRTLRMLLYTASGEAPPSEPIVPPGGGFLDYCQDPDTLPEWLTEADLDAFTRDYAETGFTGGLNWYRNLDRSWSLMAPWQGARITQPALYVGGERDLVVNGPGMREHLATLSRYVPNLRRNVLLPGCGHWTQQERPAEVNAELIEFLGGLD